MILCVGIGLAIAVAIYAAFKPYPEDFDLEGRLLVDGAKMARDTFKGVGWCSGFLIGWVLERRFVGFSTDIPMISRVTRAAEGLLSYYVVSLIFVPLVKDGIPGAAGIVISCFLQMLYVALIFPWCLKYLEKSAGQARET